MKRSNDQLKKNCYMSSDNWNSKLQNRDFMSLSQKELTRNRGLGIHYMKKDAEIENQTPYHDRDDLVYRYSDFNSNILPTEKPAQYLRLIDQTVTLGEKAHLGPRKLYTRGSRFDAVHMDNFLTSEVNARFNLNNVQLNKSHNETINIAT